MVSKAIIHKEQRNLKFLVPIGKKGAHSAQILHKNKFR
jgi:hypothetical protein